jgi:anti-anti-sigma factor
VEHLQWNWQRTAGTIVLVLSGELDRAVADRVRAQIQAAPDAEQPLIVDLRQLRFIDSSGIKELIDAYMTTTRSRRRFALVNSSEPIQHIFRIVGVDQMLPVFPTFEAALESVTGL